MYYKIIYKKNGVKLYALDKYNFYLNNNEYFNTFLLVFLLLMFFGCFSLFLPRRLHRQRYLLEKFRNSSFVRQIFSAKLSIDM